MGVFALILMIAAFLLFLGAAAGLPTGRLNLVALGLALWVLASLLGGAHI